MPRICYVDKNFSDQSLLMIGRSNAVCAEFAAQGISLTLRGLYYRLVARDLFPDSRRWLKNAAGKWFMDSRGTKNADPNYKWLGDIINDARLAGLVDWDHLADTTRTLRDLAHWEDPEQIIGAVARQYRNERWANQPVRPEVWIEKDALVGVITNVCTRNDVGYFSCRGYTSQTAMWEAAQRLIAYEDAGQQTVIIHLGDHDPSGIDMTRDIQDRLRLFGSSAEVVRIALNMDQVVQYDPPPNPTKLTDARASGYIERFHDPDEDEPGEARCWELDALDPSVLDTLIQAEIESWRDDHQWELDTTRQETDRERLTAVHERWDEVTELVDGGQDD
jgi:hypothetical protein